MQVVMLTDVPQGVKKTGWRDKSASEAVVHHALLPDDLPAAPEPLCVVVLGRMVSQP